MNLIPAFGAIAAFLLLGELIAVPQFIGGCLVFIGVLTLLLQKRKRLKLQKKYNHRIHI